jgi:hypothetical protein
MKLTRHRTAGKVTGYTLHLNVHDTYAWAHRPGRVWLCSNYAGQVISVEVDANGLYSMAAPDNDLPAAELEACIADHLPADCRHLWPVWHAEDARADASAAAIGA